MDRQHIADRLTAIVGYKVDVGLHSRIEDVIETVTVEDRKVQIKTGTRRVDYGELFTYVGGDGKEVAVPQDQVAEAERYLRSNPPPPDEPTIFQIEAEALRAKLTDADRAAARQRLIDARK